MTWERILARLEPTRERLRRAPVDPELILQAIARDRAAHFKVPSFTEDDLDNLTRWEDELG